MFENEWKNRSDLSGENNAFFLDFDNCVQLLIINKVDIKDPSKWF